ncbi:TPA: ATP-dependent metallopeptidase FtsH/Yme1/Tma family protein [Escherichia coli]|jgi:cell division protease FtsH|uniref:ATP-dependent metallopeptidase FtsH/Yme1/Tma family protein n=1 Tax=Escherichia coli TaxID=562 RepID=UPI000DE89072|nr:FtsH/Yme1/Tma family ATP-dependent metallopeptidase [Escherichia coli]EHR1105007.1 ATP-dependent metallopeptidase FtsH/Yme1/Tma family protein [Escherichia coli]EJE8219816.1 ATP-dependent metallopeptidase FtsH/Yme1/Tma family protein [Escherichia coli]EJE8394408.1 ATP-dependent metallopeptidase FtsH/Yme1/Tma family protein [Escherichia coli]MBP2901550.1 ATP-dependent metallopeptidase FtsH/Yme1/Tma family protein [Escherichia coli]MCR1069162.1 ATP-dependent metallopeptidase FtsH/Yme1/Tma fam
MEKKNQWNTGYWIVALLLLLSLQSYWQTAKTVEPVPYSEFEKALAEGRVAEVLVSDRTVTGRLKSPDSRGKTTIVATRVEPDLADRLSKYDVPYARVLESTWLCDVLSWILPAVAFFGVWFFLFRRFAEKQGMGGFLNIGKSRAKVFVEKNTGVTFADVAGGDEAKAELVEIVDFLKNPQDYGRLGARIPKGVLLVGPPGTGKTLLAKAVAGEAAVPFFSISGSEFVEMFVGVGAGRTRGVGGHDESEQTLNQLLTEMDGFDSSVGLIILAATNRPEILDQALLRAGRFDRQVLVDRPDKKGRLDILKVHVKKVTLAQDVGLEQVAALTTGFSGADLANRVNEAALAARRRRASAVELQDFTATIERIVAGLEKKSRVLNPKERETVAHHEMGHALVALALPETDPVHKISIIPRGIGALGYTLQRPTEDRFLMTRTDLEHKIAVLLGGRAAEKLVFGELSTGAADDLARATDIARDMITRFGMDEGLGYIAFEAQRPRFLDTPELAHGGCRVAESTQARIDQAIRDIVMGVFERAYRILDINRAVLERCARELLARETLDESDIRQLTQGLVRN